MKKSFLLLLLLAPLLCISQGISEENSLNYYGEKVSSKSLADLSQIDEGSLIKIQGTVLSSCPKKGCWMQVKVETDTIQVMFKDLFPYSLTTITFDATDTDIEYFTAEASFKYTMYNLTDMENNSL